MEMECGSDCGRGFGFWTDFEEGLGFRWFGWSEFERERGVWEGTKGFSVKSRWQKHLAEVGEQVWEGVRNLEFSLGHVMFLIQICTPNFWNCCGLKTEAEGKRISTYLGLQTKPSYLEKHTGLPMVSRQWVEGSWGFLSGFEHL